MQVSAVLRPGIEVMPGAWAILGMTSGEGQEGQQGWGLLLPPNECDGAWPGEQRYSLRRGLLERDLKAPHAFSGEWLVGKQPRDHFSCTEGLVRCFIDGN